MRVIRPEAHTVTAPRRPLVQALSMLATGVLALLLAVVGQSTPTGAAILGALSAIGLGIGAAWLVRALRTDPERRAGDALVAMLDPTFGDDYTLLVAPQLPVRAGGYLDGILVGPGGIRIITARDWEGRYRVRGRTWEFDAHRRGWVRCRTNPSYEATALAEGVSRWSRDAGLPELPIRAAIAFPHAHSRIILEEPSDEVVTTDNAPWWASSIGRVRRVEPVMAARVVERVLDAADGAGRRRAPATTDARA
jgi:hypothetical protein